MLHLRKNCFPIPKWRLRRHNLGIAHVRKLRNPIRQRAPSVGRISAIFENRGGAGPGVAAAAMAAFAVEPQVPTLGE